MSDRLAIGSAAAVADRHGERKSMSDDDDRLIALPRVMEIAGLGKTMIYRLMREMRFPRPCKPGGASSRWSEREVREWRDEQLAARTAA